jgi:hypothetical protein
MKETISTHLRELDGVLEIYLGNRLFVEVHGGKHTEKFVEDVLYGMGYYWLEDGTIRPRVELPITKESIYDEMCRLLTDYENGSDMVTEYELYNMLVKIQNNWEAVITVQEGN